MIRTYYTYRIRVANRERVQVEKLNLQRTSEGEPSGAFRYQSNKKKLEPLLQLACNGELNDTGKSRLLGEILFDILFDDVLRQDFVNFYYQVVQQQKQFLRVELDIDEQRMPEVAALPWEFICLPDSANLGTVWIATAPYLVFSRRRSQWIAAQPIQLAVNEKLRIALVISVPSDLPAVVYEPVQIALEKLAGEQINQVELLPIVNAANPEAIDDILSQQPHIFHFIGHGRLENETNQAVGQIALVDPELGEAFWVDADYFSELFTRYRPGLVMLQACEGGMLSASQAFFGVASRMVQQNIPVVVAMQYEVTNSTASRFARRFYKKLAAGDPVDIAAQEGRRAIAMEPATQYQRRDFATPVIFMRVEDGYLFNRVEEKKEESQPLPLTSPISSEIITRLRANFLVSSEQIKIVGTHKKLHDQLHDLEFVFPLIRDIFSHFPDKAEIGSLKIYRDKLKNIINDLNEILTKKEAWILKLEIALDELNQAIENLDPARLNNSIIHIFGVLRRQPTCININLQNAAKNLRISSEIDEMRDLCNVIADSKVGSRFREELENLSKFHEDLTQLLKTHDDFQETIDELQLMEENLNPESINPSQWEYMKKQAEIVFSELSVKYSVSLRDCLMNLDQAISSKNINKIEDNFRSYKSEMSRRFYAIDDELNKLCGRLDMVNEKLAENLKWL